MIKKITKENFRRYGWLIAYPQKHLKSKRHNLFRVVLTEPSIKGWRIAYLVLRDRSIGRLEKHPRSFESFEPVSGRTLLYVTKHKDPAGIECFYLDKPVILKKGIWHGVVARSRESEIKLTENAKVQCVYWKLDHPLSGRLR